MSMHSLYEDRDRLTAFQKDVAMEEYRMHEDGYPDDPLDGSWTWDEPLLGAIDEAIHLAARIQEQFDLAEDYGARGPWVQMHEAMELRYLLTYAGFYYPQTAHATYSFDRSWH